ncbi:MAG: transglycosylase SLT domain-containing protein [Gammaproteobacteria bacterium]|nr:transglycosylase SLT domain-containing protein [Gammaproteobacteria bacterium]
MPWTVLARLPITDARTRCRWPALAAAAITALYALAGHATTDAGGPEPLLDQDDLYDARLDYKRAIAALRAGRSREFRRTAAKLADYPLKIYLDYYQAQGRVSTMGAKRAHELRTDFGESPIGERFYRQWLNAQVRRGRWNVYLANYEPSESAAGRCNYVRALYRSGEREAALKQVRPLWVAPESQPKTCDPLFEVWIAAGHLDQDAVWERLALALDANEVSLARYLLRFFNAANADAGRLYYDAHVRPRTVRSLAKFPDTDGGRRALRHGLLRYAEDQPESAFNLWRKAEAEYAFSAADKRYIHEWLTAASADGGVVPAGAPADFSTAAVEHIARALIHHQHWEAAARWVGALPGALHATPQWRYWLGRALTAIGDADGREHLTAAAASRNYYGFLAADRIGATPALNALPPRDDPSAERALLATPTVRRMVELHAVGDLVNARREWRYAAATLDDSEQRLLVELTSRIGWIEQAIFGARDAELLDMVRFRFPMPYLSIYRRHATNVNLPVALLLAVSRQESAFNPKAVSVAGARGLMQLMPSTARLIANRIRVGTPSNRDLVDPDANVRLASHHLAALMARHNRHRALVAAAYNAGEHRVTRWVKDAEGMPTDVWIERIPFRETRDYVKGVIAFNHIYDRLLGKTPSVLADHERRIP